MTTSGKPADKVARQHRAEMPTQTEALGVVPLQAVLSTDEMNRRPSRAPDHAAENRALLALAQALADAPRSMLQHLADTLLDVFKCGSAGISLLSKDETTFFWPAIAGQWHAHSGGGATPRNFSPCGDVLDGNAPLLFKRPERRYPYFLPVMPLAEECLLVPFHVGGKAVGTIWLIAHDDRRQFDTEDLRQLQSLSRFASAAYQTLQSLDAALEQAQAARSLTDEAVRMNLALETLNAEMRKGEERYRTVFDSIGDGLCVIEKVQGESGKPLDFRYVEANPSVELQSGISGVVGRTLRQVIPDECEEWLLTFDAVLKTGEAIRFERELIAQGRVLEVDAFRVEFPNRHCVGISFRDITEHKRAEERLRSNRDTFFHLIENAPFGVYVVDAQFRLCQASAVSQNVFSNVQPLIGRDFEEIVRTVWTDPFATEALTRFRQTLETGESYVAPSTSELRKDIPGVESYDWKIQRITLPDGQFGVVCYFYDVTERKRAEDALRERDAFTSSIIRSSPDCIKVLDLEGNLLSMPSGQELLGIDDIQPFLNTSWLAFWEGEHRQAAQAAIVSAAAGEAARFIGLFRTFRGEPKWWDVAVSAIPGVDGRPARLLSVSRDITQRKHAELNLAFLASVSRELAQWMSVDGMMQTVGADIAAHLQLSICAFAEIDVTAEQVVINHEWHQQDMPSLIGAHRLADFVGDEFIRIARAGEVIVVRDAVKDPRTDSEKFATLKIASFVCVPLIRDGQWRFAMCLYKSVAYDWREDEIELTRDLTARIWTRMERLQAEDALRKSEERFRALVTASSDVVYRMSPDWSEMRQLHGQNFIVDTARPSVDWLQEYIHPDDQPRVVAVIHEAIRTKGLFELEHRVKLADGSLGWTFSHAIPLLDATGQIVEWFGTASDVTDHKRAENALRESEDRYRDLFNSMDEGYCIIEMIFDANGKPVDYVYLEVNPSFESMSGMSNAQGKRVLELVPDLEEYWLETYGKVALTGEAVRVVNEVKPLNRWFDVYAFRFGGLESRKLGILFTNITDRKRIETELNEALKTAESANRAKSSFLSSMSHELRSPLNSVLGYAQLIQSGTPAPTPLQQESVDQILKAGWFLLELIDEILDLTLIESGRLSLTQVPVPLAEVLSDCHAMVELQAQTSGIELTFQTLESDCMVRADRTRVMQVFINLLSNAIKYNRPGGTVRVSCAARPLGRLRISVEDSGQGMTEDQLERLFQPFERLGQETGAIKGTGIGLVVSKRLVELMGGQIGAQSAVGVGSVLWVELLATVALPLAPTAPGKRGAPADSRSVAALPSAATRTFTVLCIEDDPANQMLMQRLLARRTDLRLLLASDGSEGLQLARETRPDVVLMDINLPGMSGLEAMKLLSANPATAHIPVIAVSANAMRLDVEQGLQAGFFRYLTKPINTDLIMQTLDEVLKLPQARPRSKNLKNPSGVKTP